MLIFLQQNTRTDHFRKRKTTGKPASDPPSLKEITTWKDEWEVFKAVFIQTVVDDMSEREILEEGNSYQRY